MTGRGKHSEGEPTLKRDVASMLDKLPFASRAVEGGFYVQAWKRRMSRPSRSARKKCETGEVGCGRSSKKTYHNFGGGGDEITKFKRRANLMHVMGWCCHFGMICHYKKSHSAIV